MSSSSTVSSITTFLPASTWLIILVPILYLLFCLTSDYITYTRLPPGPRPLPLVGNAFQFPKGQPLWRTLTTWSETYGPIFGLFLGRTPTLIITDPHIAHELLSTRSLNYSSRPRLVVFGEVFSRGSSTVMQPYGNSWSVRRRLFHHALNPQAMMSYAARQEAEASKTMVQILGGPQMWMDCVNRFTASVVFTVGYGRRIGTLFSRRSNSSMFP